MEKYQANRAYEVEIRGTSENMVKPIVVFERTTPAIMMACWYRCMLTWRGEWPSDMKDTPKEIDKTPHFLFDVGAELIYCDRSDGNTSSWQ